MNTSYRHSNKLSEKGFEIAINIYIKKPQLINKRLWGVKTIFQNKLHQKRSIVIYENKKFLNTSEFADKDIILSYLSTELYLEKLVNDDNNVVIVTVLELLPKVYKDSHAYVLVCFHTKELKVIFYDLTPESLKQNVCPNYAYSIQLDSETILVKANCDDTLNSYHWLISTVVPQLLKWAADDTPKSSLQSLSLISNDRYYSKYNYLKNKYGVEMVKKWPETTDPAKFVYEDIAIATYLLLLWEQDTKQLQSNKLQSFVDLGCGNGLLVFILTSEGHTGVGIDIRKRNIWDLYPKSVNLQVKTITPSDLNVYPDADWIIGNHSDELTPWIPVVTLRSSYYTKFFLLPCCSFNFDGSKYERKNSSKSQYGEYLEYIESLSVECGFITEIDRLKIPSTKRTCIVGRQRSYLPIFHKEQCQKIQTIINPKDTVMKNENNWISNFKPRDAVEKVRNCTKIDKTLIEIIVNKIAFYLLKDCEFENAWSSGSTVAISELVSIIPIELLKKLKAECGGLQTLLKNNNHIFFVRCGKINLRFPKTVKEVMSSSDKNKTILANNIKKKPCWFYNNHPQGCPLIDNDCSFKH